MRTLKHLPKLAALGAMLVLVACSSDVAPSAPVATDDVAPALMPSDVAVNAVKAEQVDVPMPSVHGVFANAYPANAVSYQFTYNPTTDATFILGTHMVSFPKYTICDPSVSGYGASTWLTTCTKLQAPITMTATTWIDVFGRAQIDFSVDIRFYKNYNNQLPAIYLRDPNAALSTWGRVDYCSAAGCVDEATADATLATQRDPVTGYLFRLIRHFSGYNVWA